MLAAAAAALLAIPRMLPGVTRALALHTRPLPIVALWPVLPLPVAAVSALLFATIAPLPVMPAPRFLRSCGVVPAALQPPLPLAAVLAPLDSVPAAIWLRTRQRPRWAGRRRRRWRAWRSGQLAHAAARPSC
jgi:hypothetical protein